MAILNLTKYAEHRGCRYQAVQQSLAAGRIMLHHKEGRQSFFDVEDSDRRWVLNTDDRRQRNPTRAQKAATRAPDSRRTPPPDYRDAEGIGTYLPAGTCEAEFHDIMNLVNGYQEQEQRGVALAVIAAVCRGLGAQDPGPDASAQITAMKLPINRLPAAQRAAGAFELIERLAGRLAMVVDPAENWQP